MIAGRAIDKAAEMLLEAAPRGSRVILFGSQATRAADDRSDVDFLVIEPEVADRSREMLRLEQAVRPLKLPVDIVVLSAVAFDRWRGAVNSLAYWAAREGKVYGPAT